MIPVLHSARDNSRFRFFLMLMRVVLLRVVFGWNSAFAAVNADAPNLVQHSVRSGNDKVVYWLSKGPQNDLPLVMYILGSGCMSQLEHTRKAPFILSDAYSKKVNLVFVEKPGILPSSKNIGNAVGCRDAFKRTFTVANWIRFHVDVYQNLVTTEKLKPKKILILGHSEGAGMAAHLATTTIPVTHVALLGARSTNHIFDFLQDAGDDNGK